MAAEMRIDNFGSIGTRCLFDALGVEEVPATFRACASRHLIWAPHASGSSTQDGPSVFKVLAYAEYSLVRPRPLTGSLLRENGLKNPGGGRPRWLRPSRLPINSFVDRELCAEFQVLEATCEAIAGAVRAGDVSSRAEVSGIFQLLVSGACCISCVAAVHQFQLLWPGLSIAVGIAPRVGKKMSTTAAL